MYGPTREAQLVRRNTVVKGVHVGIGGEVTLSSGTVIPEATEEQYEEIFNRGGHDHLIEKKHKKNRKKEATAAPSDSSDEINETKAEESKEDV